MKFNGKDYDHWIFRMEIILDQQEVKKCIEKENTAPDDTFSALDKKCKSSIVQCIGNSQLQHVKEKSTVYQMWTALEIVFQRQGVASQLYLRRKLLTMKLKEGEHLEKHLLKFEETVRKLKGAGAKLEVKDVVSFAINVTQKY